MNKKMFRAFALVSLYIIMLSISLGAVGALLNNKKILLLHPYIFFIGFGNISVLILNKYIMTSFFPNLKISYKKQKLYIFLILLSLILITISVLFTLPFLKIIISLILFAIIFDSSKNLLSHLTIKDIWSNLALRYYVVDMLFVLNAAVGLAALGYRETFPNTILVPYIVTESLYFLGSSFPLSLSTLGFIYSTLHKKKKKELLTLFFEMWFYVFITGVLTFLILIVLDTFYGMIISSSTLILGVIFILFILLKQISKKNIIISYLILAISLLIMTGIYGLMIINSMIGREFGTRLSDVNMWIYKSHTHAALLGWITLSFLGILYSIYPYILNGKKIVLYKNYLNKTQLKIAKLQLIITFVSVLSILISFYLENKYSLFVFGIILSSSLNITIVKFIKAK